MKSAKAFKRAPKKKDLRHFEWLVRYQVQGWSTERIAEHYADGADLDRLSVADAVRKTAELIGLTLRPRSGAAPEKPQVSLTSPLRTTPKIAIKPIITGICSYAESDLVRLRR